MFRLNETSTDYINYRSFYVWQNFPKERNIGRSRKINLLQNSISSTYVRDIKIIWENELNSIPI